MKKKNGKSFRKLLHKMRKQVKKVFLVSYCVSRIFILYVPVPDDPHPLHSKTYLQAVFSFDYEEYYTEK